jgi:hypothetical protein
MPGSAPVAKKINAWNVRTAASEYASLSSWAGIDLGFIADFLGLKPIITGLVTSCLVLLGYQITGRSRPIQPAQVTALVPTPTASSPLARVPQATAPELSAALVGPTAVLPLIVVEAPLSEPIFVLSKTSIAQACQQSYRDYCRATDDCDAGGVPQNFRHTATCQFEMQNAR